MGIANESLTRNIEHSLSIGADKASVESFLRRNDIDFTYYPASAHADFNFPQSAIRDAYTKDIALPIFRCRIHMTFRLDQQEKLTGYKQKSVCTE
jgi:hypothetical protein